MHIFISRNGIWGTWCLVCTVWNEIIKLMAVRHVGAHVFMCTTFFVVVLALGIVSLLPSMCMHVWLSVTGCFDLDSVGFFFLVVLFLLFFIIIIIALDENDRHIFTTCSTVDNVSRTISTQKQNEWVG